MESQKGHVGRNKMDALGEKGFVKHFLISREAPKEELAVMRRGIK